MIFQCVPTTACQNNDPMTFLALAPPTAFRKASSHSDFGTCFRHSLATNGSSHSVLCMCPYTSCSKTSVPILGFAWGNCKDYTYAGTLDGLYQHTLIATGTRLWPVEATFLGHILGTKPAQHIWVSWRWRRLFWSSWASWNSTKIRRSNRSKRVIIAQ